MSLKTKCERRECGGSRLERHFAGLDVESVVRDGNRGNRRETETAKFDFHAAILPNPAPAENTQSGTIGADDCAASPSREGRTMEARRRARPSPWPSSLTFGGYAGGAINRNISHQVEPPSAQVSLLWDSEDSDVGFP